MAQKLGFLSLCAAFIGTACIASGAGTNLVANGSFEQAGKTGTAPEFWATGGNARIKQELRLDGGRDGRPCAKLICSNFSGDGPDYHAMICQVGKVAVERGRWYRLVCWAKAEALKFGSVEIALSDTRRWANAGLSDAFTPTSQWQRFEFLFRATQDLPAENSRLQFWFKSTGALWLDDIELTESDVGQEWFPQIATDSVKNFVPNSSFECGSANWGSYTWGLAGWAGNLYRLEGEIDRTGPTHGDQCLRISIAPDTAPVFHFDYYEPVRQPVRRVLAANHGWFRVKTGETLTLSAWLRSDAEGATAELAAIGARDQLQHKAVKVGRSWQRFAFTFKASQPFLFVAVGLDGSQSETATATLWIDAVQLERGDHSTEYEPRAPVESFLTTDSPGHIRADPILGMELVVRSFNNLDEARTLSGSLSVTDFFDRQVFTHFVTQSLPPHSGQATTVAGETKGQQGFFRAVWTAEGQTNTLRCAILDSRWAKAEDSPFGFNHAYPWDFLVDLAQQAGVKWWRDWSAQWNVVQPNEGGFEFLRADEQITRVLKLKGNVDVLLPFPSAKWSSAARQDEVERAADGNSYLRARLPVSYAPRQLEDFGAYAAAVAKHYGGFDNNSANTFEILNEPVYTDYALPRKVGYGLKDYTRLLETAHRAIKAVNPRAQVVGGLGANITATLTHEFITGGGLGFVDVLDVHLYDAARPAEGFEEAFRTLEDLMRKHGGPKPVWITEWGCYADDDPACVPVTVGDATMNRCRWPSERSAAEHIVKFSAVAFAHGVRKIFFHAGTCGAINAPDGGGVLFEYGGTPRKMLPAVAVFTGILGVPMECVHRETGGTRSAYVFKTGNRAVGITWGAPEAKHQFTLNRSVRALDIMGNELPKPVLINQSPIYLVSDRAEDIVKVLSGRKPGMGL